jgi:hypothetical protein
MKSSDWVSVSALKVCAACVLFLLTGLLYNSDNNIGSGHQGSSKADFVRGLESCTWDSAFKGMAPSYKHFRFFVSRSWTASHKLHIYLCPFHGGFNSRESLCLVLCGCPSHQPRLVLRRKVNPSRKKWAESRVRGRRNSDLPFWPQAKLT